MIVQLARLAFRACTESGWSNDNTPDPKETHGDYIGDYRATLLYKESTRCVVALKGHNEQLQRMVSHLCGICVDEWIAVKSVLADALARHEDSFEQ